MTFPLSAMRSIRARTNINNTVYLRASICQTVKKTHGEIVWRWHMLTQRPDNPVHWFVAPLACFYPRPSDRREWSKSFSHAAIFSKFSAASAFRLCTRSLGEIANFSIFDKRACAGHVSKAFNHTRALYFVVTVAAFVRAFSNIFFWYTR